MFGGVQSLQDMYVTNFTMMQMHKWSLTELENMIPFEREIYLHLMKAHLKRKEEQDNINKQNQRAAIARANKQVKKRR